MNWTIRVEAGLLDGIRADLHRPHEFANERVGFARCRVASLGGGGMLVLPFEFNAVPDNQYVREETVGACIGAAAIRSAMAAALSGATAVLHVHMHEGRGQPRFSSVDIQNYPKLVCALQHAGPTVPHGALLLSRDSVNALIWAPGERHPAANGRVVIVGRPMGFIDAGARYA